MTTHWRAKAGSIAFALAAALFVASPSYGFWFLFGYPHHSNSSSHYDDCCAPDYGYVYHHENSHDEPYFKEQGSSEHFDSHHRSAQPACKSQKAPDKKKVVSFRCEDDCDSDHGHHGHHNRHHH